jgi:hypothetical protein
MTKRLYRCSKCGKEVNGKRSATKHAKRHTTTGRRQFVEDWMEDIGWAHRKRRNV